MGNGQSWFSIAPLDVNDPSIPVTQGQGKLQIWGPIKKTFWKPTGLGDPFFRIPRTVNGQYIHCKCENISEFMRGTETFWASVLSGKVIPACWDDREISTDPITLKYHFNPYSITEIMKGVKYSGDNDIPTFSLYLNHPDFAIFSMSNKGITGIPVPFPLQPVWHLCLALRVVIGNVYQSVPVAAVNREPFEARP